MTDPLSAEEIERIRRSLPIIDQLVKNANLSHQLLGTQQRFSEELASLRVEMKEDRRDATARHVELHEVKSLSQQTRAELKEFVDATYNQNEDVNRAIGKLSSKIDNIASNPPLVTRSDGVKLVWWFLALMSTPLLLRIVS